ncbi:MAG: ABC transporter ATP-binding protein [Anaerolineae bacterium]|nr:ABC transporter ATP-binding protein [Anaerolineae bacterium]
MDDVSFKVKGGGSLAIIGPSGSGKTTLLRMIAGLDTPDSGAVLYNGVPLDEIPREDRGIGMVFQNYALIPAWDSEQNIGFFLRLRKRSAEVPARVQQVSKITGVGIEHLMQKFPRQLSGGEKQRVAIARAFARDLKLLIFDEPFANLDAKLRTTARMEARRLLSEYPVTTLYVTHDQQEASLMSERVMIMRDGHIEQVGSYQHLYYHPVNLFVAEFVGVPITNLYPGYAREGRWYNEIFGGYEIPVEVPDGTPITLGIRAEFISPGGSIPLTITAVTPFFAERYTLLEGFIGDVESRVRIPMSNEIRVGDTVRCDFDSDHLLFFDTRSGERLGDPVLAR